MVAEHDVPFHLIGTDRLAPALIAEHPHWIYHLSFERPGPREGLSPAFAPTFLTNNPDWLPRLRQLLGCRSTFHVGVKELAPGHHDALSAPATAFPIGTDVNGESWGLAL